MHQDLLSVLFVVLWGIAGFAAGVFFHRVRRQQREMQPLGKLPLEAARLVTLLVFLLLVVAASEVGRLGDVSGGAKTWAVLVCVLGCIAGIAWPRISDSEASEMLARFEQVGASSVKLVHFLHHYLADEDLRLRNDEYARLQTKRLRQFTEEAVASS